MDPSTPPDRRPVRVLLFGGTTEASALGRALAERPDVEVTTSFAGRTTAPRAPVGHTRVGGFGGVSGLVEHVHASGVDVLIDATHPFAARMRWHVAEAAELAGRPRLRVERPGWVAAAGDRWERVPDLSAAAAAIDAAGYRRVLLTTGRGELAPFARCRAAWFLVRTIEPPDPLPLARAELLLARGPFTVADEGALLDTHDIDAVVTKDSGGEATVAKLVAARERGLPVVVVDRPPSPAGNLVRTVDEALRWFDAVAGAARGRS